MSTAAGQRLLLALKTSLAVGIAWLLARYAPGVAQRYPYYAPLGALVSMYPTFMGSIRAGLQTLTGITLGILLAAGVLLLGSPNIFSISLAVGLGVLAAGHPRLGAGREYVPVAALFVLIVGGQDADSFSVGYAVQMSLGILVGLAVNMLIFPPLALDAARLGVSRGRNVLVNQLEDIGYALVEHWPPERKDWAERTEVISATVSDIRGAVYHAHESQKGNPRAYLHSRHRLASENFADLAVLEAVAFHVRDVTEVLSNAVWGSSMDGVFDAKLCTPMSECLRSVAHILKLWDDAALDQQSFDQALTAVDNLTSELRLSAREEHHSMAPGAAVALDSERILRAVHRRVLAQAENAL
ncbi:FUSC family protein [Arthrobacter cryoconiti]|uniref:Aromatic acid exporter family protein n=1 Tax=Arthrobacter cryoconiti TaxID=748907 RepID=A0ABV8QZR9_9MICC|nr:aromatic acid exporter family protein [Arthrobacter cryoconiti]MCC9068378.1 aromatic acid exporter family protein [Arthrobacter cryoconiti]